MSRPALRRVMLCGMLCGLLWAVAPGAARAGYDSWQAADTAKIRTMAEMYAAMYEVDPALVLAVIRAESAFDRYAESPAGARGVMQIMPGTGRDLGMEDQRSLNDNIEAGVRYLRGLLDRFEDPELAVAAYNAGPGAVDRHGGVPPYKETQAFVARVMDFWARERVEAEARP